jgi:MinD-like ATPase involved in chromosome partitioning or flagellar assembly/tetratricopeptide (TPR) repeat protein
MVVNLTIGDRPFGEIVTFYSYKGGTGRSMALANVAYLLGTDNHYTRRNVLAIDWDLEAPGLQRYFRSGRERGSAEAQRGLIDFFRDVHAFYREKAPRPEGELAESRATDDQAARLFEAVMQRHSLAEHVQEVPGIPRLRLMAAGARISSPKYAEDVRKFDWEAFYLEYGSFFAHLREFLMKEYAYVLIDSRTGVTDISGICTRVMPEKLVAVFAPNRQNIDGVIETVRRATGYRQRSSDVRDLVVFPVASRLDAQASRLRTLWRKGGAFDDQEVAGYQPMFEALFRDIYGLDACRLEEFFSATEILHDSDYAYGERIAARAGVTDRASIGHACANLTARLTKLNAPWEQMPEDDAKAARSEERAASVALERTARRSRLAWIVTGVVLVVALVISLKLYSQQKVSQAEARVAQALTAKDDREARRLLDEAVSFAPKLAQARFERGRLRARTGDISGAREDLDIGVHIDPGFWALRYARGDVRLLQHDASGAGEDFEEAIKLNPNPKGTSGSASGYYGRARARHALGDEARALADVREALDRGGDGYSADLHELAGDILTKRGHPAEASKEYRAARDEVLSGRPAEQRRDVLLAAARKTSDSLLRALILREIPESVFPLGEARLLLKDAHIPMAMFQGGITEVRFSGDGKSLALTTNEGVDIVSIDGLGPRRHLAISPPPRLAFFASRNSRVVTAGSAGVTIWDAATGSRVAQVDYFSKTPAFFSVDTLSEDQNQAYIVGDPGRGDTIFHVNVANGTAAWAHYSASRIVDLDYQRHRLLFSTDDGRVWTLAHQVVKREYEVPAADRALFISDQVLSTIANGTNSWTTFAGKRSGHIVASQYAENQLSRSVTHRFEAGGPLVDVASDGDFVGAATSAGIMVAAITREVVGRYHPAAGNPTCIDIRRKQLLTGSSAGTVDLQDIGGGGIPIVLAAASAQAMDFVAFSQGGKNALALSRDGIVRVWRLGDGPVSLTDGTAAAALDRLRGITSACLTAEDRSALLGERAGLANKAYEDCEQKQSAARARP